MQSNLMVINQTCNKGVFKVNKTEVLPLSANTLIPEPDTNFYIGEDELKNVQSIKYLGRLYF